MAIEWRWVGGDSGEYVPVEVPDAPAPAPTPAPTPAPAAAAAPPALSASQIAGLSQATQAAGGAEAALESGRQGTGMGINLGGGFTAVYGDQYVGGGIDNPQYQAVFGGYARQITPDLYEKYSPTGQYEGTYSSKDTGLQTIAAMVAAPFLAELILPAVSGALGVSTSSTLANSVANALAKAGVGIATGQDPGQALAGAVLSVGLGSVTSDIGGTLRTVIGNDAVSNAVLAGANSAITTLAGGGSATDIAKAAVGSALGTGIANVSGSTQFGRLVGQLATGQSAETIIGSAIGGAASQIGREISNRTPTAPAATPFTPGTMNVSGGANAIINAIEGGTQTAFAGPAAGAVGAAAAQTEALLLRLAATPQGQQALREAANVSTAVRDALIATGVFGAAGVLTFMQGASLVPERPTTNTGQNVSELVQQIPTGISGVGGTSTAGAGRGVVNPPFVTPGVTAPTTNIDILQQLTNTGYTPPEAYVIDGQTVPVTADVNNVAARFNLTVEEAAALQQQSPTLFAQLVGNVNTGEPISTETMPLRDLRIYESMLRGDPQIDTGNVYIAGQQPSVPAPEPATGQAPSPAVGQPIEGTVISINPATGEGIIMTSDGSVRFVDMAPTTQPGVSVVVNPVSNFATPSRPSPAATPTTPVVSQPAPTTQPVTQPVTQPTPQPGAQPITQPITEPVPEIDIEPQPEPQPQPVTQPGPLVQPAPLVQPQPEPVTQPKPEPTTEPAPKPVVEPKPETTPVTRPTTPTTPTTPTRPTTPTTPTAPPLTPEEPRSPVTPPTTPPTAPPEEPKPPAQPPAEPPAKPETPTKPAKPPAPKPPTKPSPLITVSPPRRPPTPAPAFPAFAVRGGSPLEQALSAYVPPGEVDVGTGKPRRDVWNEASLRLKDALGL